MPGSLGLLVLMGSVDLVIAFWGYIGLKIFMEEAEIKRRRYETENGEFPGFSPEDEEILRDIRAKALAKLEQFKKEGGGE